MRRVAPTIAVVLAAGLLGCGEDRRDAPAAAPPATRRALTPGEARARFCRTVFPLGTVASLIGVPDLLPLPEGQPPAQGVGACRYRGQAASSPEVSLVVDCRIDHPDAATLRGLATGKPGYREVALGTGGVYTGDGQTQRHRLAFVHPDPSCAIYVSTSRLVADRTAALAAQVVAALDGGGAPR